MPESKLQFETKDKKQYPVQILSNHPKIVTAAQKLANLILTQENIKTLGN